MGATDPKRLEWNRKWREANRERVRAWQKADYDKNREKYLAKQKAAYEQNKEVRNKRDSARGLERRRQRRMEAINALGGKCVACGFSDSRALCIDHINGGGDAERASKTREAYFKHITEQAKLGSQEYQVLCANCHTIRHSEDFQPWRKHCL